MGSVWRKPGLDHVRNSRIACDGESFGPIDAHRTAALVTNSLGMEIEQRRPAPGETVIHSDQGPQFTSRTFTRRVIDSGLLPSMGSVGACYDNAMAESFWSLMQVVLVDFGDSHFAWFLFNLAL